jgi:CheY-like chemotaxis protein
MTLSILVASNNPQHADLVKLATVDQDCNVIVATTQALALFLAQKNLPHVIVSSTRLSDETGVQFLQELRMDSELRALPLVFIGTPAELKVVEQQLPDGFAPDPANTDANSSEPAAKSVYLYDKFGSTVSFDGVVIMPAEPNELLSVLNPLINRSMITRKPREIDSPE